MRRVAYALGSVLFGALILAACGGNSASLTESEWIVADLNGQPTLPLGPITASFTRQAQVSGVSGCNTYQGTFETQGDTIRFGPMATTLMACPGEIMDQESVYFSALDDAERFEVDGQTLTLYGPGDAALVVYVVEDQDLAGTNWDVISYNNGTGGVTSLVTGSVITAAFDDEGQMSGNASCNDYSGPYETDGAAITVGPMASTQQSCGDVMDQERQYLRALESAATYTVSAGRLELRTADNALAVSMLRSNP